MEIISLGVLKAPTLKRSNKGKLQTSTKKKDARLSMHLHLEEEITNDLNEIQHLPTLQTDEGKQFSRSTIIRRAVAVYCNRMLHASQEGVEDEIAKEFYALLAMSKVGRHSRKQKGGND